MGSWPLGLPPRNHLFKINYICIYTYKINLKTHVEPSYDYVKDALKKQTIKLFSP